MKLTNFIKNSIEHIRMFNYYNALLNSDIEHRQQMQLDILFGNVNGTDLY